MAVWIDCSRPVSNVCRHDVSVYFSFQATAMNACCTIAQAQQLYLPGILQAILDTPAASF